MESVENNAIYRILQWVKVENHVDKWGKAVENKNVLWKNSSAINYRKGYVKHENIFSYKLRSSADSLRIHKLRRGQG